MSSTYGVVRPPQFQLAIRDVESDGINMETKTEPIPIKMPPKYFPVFMISISAIIQVKINQPKDKLFIFIHFSFAIYINADHAVVFYE